ncbi:hypothetical protein [Flavobacterium cyanobacteriorum]|nr:hypothetical protein [Flavobacterium cyanobacteriorum]
MKNVLWCLMFATQISCGHKAEIKEKYCGVEMSGFEVLDYKKMGDDGYDYTEDDKLLLSELKTGINNLFDNKEAIEVYFAMKDKGRIALYIVAPDDKAMVEKISCYVLASGFKNLPPSRNLLFYTNEHNSLVAAVKTKPVNT